MSKLTLSAVALALAFSATACLDHTQGPLEQITGTKAALQDGSISGSWNNVLAMRDTTGDLKNLTISARDVGGDGTVVNSETYANLDHDFSLSLPGGHYKVDITDLQNHVLVTYPDVTVDGDTKLAPQGAAE